MGRTQIHSFKKYKNPYHLQGTVLYITREREREREIYKVAALWSSIVYREGLISMRSSGTKPHT